jgi:hypothetical protein
MLAMIVVGVWSALAAGRRVWIVPAIFVAAMLAGAGFAQAGGALPAAETAIAMSVVALGVLIAAGVGLPVGAGAALIALFAVFHGYAHGIEATGAVTGYMAGFAVTTAVLHVSGIALGRAIAVCRMPPACSSRYCGIRRLSSRHCEESVMSIDPGATIQQAVYVYEAGPALALINARHSRAGGDGYFIGAPCPRYRVRRAIIT